MEVPVAIRLTITLLTFLHPFHIHGLNIDIDCLNGGPASELEESAKGRIKCLLETSGQASAHSVLCLQNAIQIVGEYEGKDKEMLIL
jgi:hypothetical protein